MEIILILSLFLIMTAFLYLIFRLLKWLYNNKTRRIWTLSLLGVFILATIINNVFLKKMEFFPLESETTYSNGNIYQHIVIAKPPKNLDSLASIVIRYSRSNNNLCEIVEKENYLRIFYYRETWDTPRDFKSNDDDCNFDSENIGCHTDDIICVLEKKSKQKNKWEFTVRKNSDSEWVHYPFEVKCTDDTFIKHEEE